MLAAGAVLLLAAACVSPDTPVSTGELPAHEQPAGDDPVGGAMLALPPARAVHDNVENLQPRSFESALHDETDDSFHVLFWAGREPCYALGDVEVVETADAITVTLYEGNMRGDDIACPDDAQHASVPIVLELPVGDRVLVDGSTGQEIPIDFIRPGDVAAR